MAGDSINDRIARVSLRRMVEADIAAVRALHQRSFAALARARHSDAQIAAHIALIGAPDYADDLRRSHIMLAIAANGALLATAGWLAVEGEPAIARIRKVFVDPGAARQGLATRMVADAEARARAAGRTRFIVRANLNAVPLYKKLGYVSMREDTMDAAGIGLPVLFMEKRAPA